LIKSFITDPSDDKQAHINTQDKLNGLIVSTRELKEYKFDNKFFTSDDFGINMNISATVPIENEELIYNENAGTPTEWDTSVVGGGPLFDFTSTSQVYNGNYSIDATLTIANSVMQLYRSSTIDLNGYQFLTGYIYITGWSSVSFQNVSFYGWNTNTSTIVGNSVNISNYINFANLNTWQKFVIPLSDMGLTEKIIDAIRIETLDVGPGIPPNYYLDLINLEGSSSPDSTGIVEYKIIAEPNTYSHVCNIGMTIVGEYDSTLSDGTLHNIPINSFLNVSELENGILFVIVQDNSTMFSAVFNNLFDLLSLTASNITSSGYDGTYTWVKINIPFVEPIKLKPNLDKISIFIRDDLSDLNGFRMYACCRCEDT